MKIAHEAYVQFRNHCHLSAYIIPPASRALSPRAYSYVRLGSKFELSLAKKPKSICAGRSQRGLVPLVFRKFHLLALRLN